MIEHEAVMPPIVRNAQRIGKTHRTTGWFRPIRMSTDTPSEPCERLQWARREAGYSTPSEAAEAFGWNKFTYLSHENGNRGITASAALRYAKAFRRSAGWILTGEGGQRPNTVQVQAYIGENSEVQALDAKTCETPLIEVSAPPGCPPTAVALIVRNEAGLDRFSSGDVLIYWNPVQPTEMLYRLCVVCLKDGRRFIKQIAPGTEPDRYTLLGKGAAPMQNLDVDWVAAIEWVKPAI